MGSDATLIIDEQPTEGVERPRSELVHYEIERQVLCDRIEKLERELERERQQRQQIVEQYERLLAEKTAAVNDTERGLLEQLF